MKASECKCIECDKPAVAFWPLIDPDIPAQPYCRECLNKQKIKLLVSMFGYEKKAAEIYVEKYGLGKDEDRD